MNAHLLQRRDITSESMYIFLYNLLFVSASVCSPCSDMIVKNCDPAGTIVAAYRCRHIRHLIRCRYSKIKSH